MYNLQEGKISHKIGNEIKVEFMLHRTPYHNLLGRNQALEAI